MSKFPLTELAVKMYCPDNVVLTDDAGLPSIMVYIPAFKNSDVLTGGDDSTHPAFIVDGVQVPGFYYSKYQNITHNGKAYSLPGEDPQIMTTFDMALQFCEDKGHGWHLSTAAEWAAIALWCKKNGFLPYGNNSEGKDTRETEYKAILSDKTVSRVATGTGPLTWSHDRTSSGIWDLNGNIFEWQGGIRTVSGELQILANNDAADANISQDKNSAYWKAINAISGTLVEPEANLTGYNDTAGNTVRLDFVGGAWQFTTFITDKSNEGRTCNFSSVTCDESIGEPAKILLRALALLPDVGANASEYENDTVSWINDSAECYVLRGGDAGYKNRDGVFCSYSGVRASKNNSIGFRAAYIPNLETGMSDYDGIELY